MDLKTFDAFSEWKHSENAVFKFQRGADKALGILYILNYLSFFFIYFYIFE